MAQDFLPLMAELLTHARAAAAKGEVPVAAMVLGADGARLSLATNQVEARHNGLLHAEMVALQMAVEKTGQKFLTGATLLVTLEPCALCAAAISALRIKTLVIGGYDQKSGGVFSGARVFASANCHHAPTIIDGLLARDCEQLLQDFFKDLR